MSEPNLARDTADPLDHPRKASFLRRKLPYIAVLTLAVIGVAFTNMSHQPISVVLGVFGYCDRSCLRRHGMA